MKAMFTPRPIRGRILRLVTLFGICITLLAPALFTATAGARQGTPAEPPPADAAAGGSINIFSLFTQSFDFFTILLLVCSLVAWTVIVKCFFEIRSSAILPPAAEGVIREMARAGAWTELRRFVEQDDAFVSRVVAAGMSRTTGNSDSVRDAAEMAASEECARWFRKIEPLNVLGNLGPLLGLSGTVWGMVIAFAALGQAGGQASPATLSLGVSKALFHTLLGLLLAVPALAVFGFYRGIVDRLCNRAMGVAADLVELLPPPAVMNGPGGAAGGGRGQVMAPAPGQARV